MCADNLRIGSKYRNPPQNAVLRNIKFGVKPFSKGLWEFEGKALKILKEVIMEKKLIQFKNIVKEFDGKLVLKGINLDIYENEFVTLLGPSGCGKTTLLRILGGFLTQNEGQVLFEVDEISTVPPY